MLEIFNAFLLMSLLSLVSAWPDGERGAFWGGQTGPAKNIQDQYR